MINSPHPCGQKRPGSRGQVAVILILFIAILLVALGVVMNIQKVSQVKVSQAIAVDSAAAVMASSMASFAESMYQGTIRPGPNPDGKQLTRRETSAILSYIVAAIIAIISLVLCCTGIGSIAGAPGLSLAIAIIAVAASVGAVVLQVAWVQPAQHKAWNDMMSKLDPADRFREMGLMAVLERSALDPVKVPDTSDANMDGYYVGDGTDSGDAAKVSRYSFLYGARVAAITGVVVEANPIAEAFLKALAEFTYDRDLHVDVNGTPPSFYNFKWEPLWRNTPDNFALFDLPDTGMGTYSSLKATQGYFKNESEFNCIPPGNKYFESLSTSSPNNTKCPANGSSWKLVGDAMLEDYSLPTAQFMSFREFIGRDDENKIATYKAVGNTLPIPRGNYETPYLTKPEWLEKDAMGILYKLFWKVDKAKLERLASMSDDDHRGCFWCGKQGNTSYSSCPVPGTGSAHPDWSGFSLPYGTQACNANNPHYQSSPNGLRDCWCLTERVDPVDLSLESKVKTDTFPYWEYLNDHSCFGSTISPTSDPIEPYELFSWKRGVNEQCSEDVPYYECLGKSCSQSCMNVHGYPGCCVDDGSLVCPATPDCSPTWGCGIDGSGNPQPNQAFWRTDLVDSIRYDKITGIEQFVYLAQRMLETNPASLKGSDLLSGISGWIGKLAIPPDQPAEIGHLDKWVRALQSIQGELERLKNKNFSTHGFICPGAGNPALIYNCLQNKINMAQNCLSNCSESNCRQIADDLGLYFEDPSPGTNSPYVDQSTGCNILAHPAQKYYVFKYELANWAAKLVHRRDYLFGSNGTGGLYKELTDAIALTQQAMARINAFLSDARVTDFKTWIANLSSVAPTTASLDPVIYAWKDEDKANRPGQWHVVYADARLPTRCGGNCQRKSCYGPGDCREPYMPKIRDYGMFPSEYYSLIDYDGLGDCGTKTGAKNNDLCSPFKVPQCFTWFLGVPFRIIDCCKRQTYKYSHACFKGGTVKARTIRYDESSGVLGFAPGITFWKFNFQNKNIGSWMTDVNTKITNACAVIMPQGGGSPDNGDSYGMPGAFMINKESNANASCLALMKSLLKEGVESKSCAEYFYRQNAGDDEPLSKSAFGFKFINCWNPNW